MKASKAKARSAKKKRGAPTDATEQSEKPTAGWTDKQRAFVSFYTEYGSISFLNGAESARRAGHSKKTAKQIATENLSKPYLRNEIDRRLKEFTLGPSEVLARLTAHAKGDMRHFVKQLGKGGDVVADLTTPEAQALMPLVKSVSFFRKSGGEGDKQWEQTQTKVELYDAQSALVHLGKYHKLFVDRTRADDYEEEIADLVRSGSATLDDVYAEFGEEIAARVAVRLGVLPSQSRTVQTETAREPTNQPHS